MHYIKDIFEKRETEHAHNKFIRYSKGVFVGPIIRIKPTRANIKVNTSFHTASEILQLMADLLANQEVLIKGNLSWNKDLSPELEKIGIKHLKVSKSRGIFNYALENTVKLKEFLEHLGNYHILINFKTEDVKLTTKNKYPKPNKEITSDFCKAVFPASMTKKILSEFAFDVKETNIKDILIQHEIIIDEIKIPKADTFEEARKLAKRGGLLKRTVIVNGMNPVTSEIKFSV